MTVYVLSWGNSDMETMVFSSFEKANSVAKFILNHLPSGKIAWEEQDEDSIVYHLDHQNDEDVNEDFDDDDEEYEDDMLWDELTIYPYEIDIGLEYLNS